MTYNSVVDANCMLMMSNCTVLLLETQIAQICCKIKLHLIRNWSNIWQLKFLYEVIYLDERFLPDIQSFTLNSTTLNAVNSVRGLGIANKILPKN